jgi:hypothetical protein
MSQEKERLFGTDGVRGMANCYPMTAEMALSLGQAIAHVFHSARGEHKRIIIGKDTRLSGYMFENALVAGITSMGVDVIQVGPMPTPGMAFLTADMRCHAGVMISASHNPYQDNGIKFFSSDGFKLPDEVENRIEALIGSGQLTEQCAESDHIGRAKRIDDAEGPVPGRAADRPRLRQWRGLQGGPDRARRAGRRGVHDRGRSQRPQHQRQLRLAVPAEDGSPRVRAARGRGNRPRRRRRPLHVDRLDG